MYDFAIVGGGIYGSAVAYHLSGRGYSIGLFDREKPGAGASGGEGKRGVRASKRDVRELPLMREAYDIWPKLSDQLDVDTGYERIGGVHLFESETSGSTGGVNAARAMVAVQNQFGIETRLWDQQTVRGEYPGISTLIDGAVYAPNDGVASHESTTAGFVQRAQELGATVHEDTTVDEVIVAKSGQAVGVRCEGQEWPVRQAVFIANNAGAPTLLEQLGLSNLPVWAVVPQALFLRTREAPHIPYLTSHTSRPLSVKMLSEDRVMLSGGWRGKWNQELDSGEALEANIEGNIETLTRVFPYLTDPYDVVADASRKEAATYDQIPIVDRVPGVNNILVATGWTGHGWALAPAVTRHIADWLDTGRRPDELRAFGLARFEGGAA